VAALFTTMSTKGQTVIPAAVREELGLEPGTRFTVRIERGQVVLDPETLAAKLRKIREMRGITKGGPSGTDLLLEERRLERARELREEGW
jgi:AbrB family looped-hinge helix DNA binding protein